MVWGLYVIPKKKYTVVGIDSNKKKLRDKCSEKNLKTYKSINDFKENIDVITFGIHSNMFQP